MITFKDQYGVECALWAIPRDSVAYDLIYALSRTSAYVVSEADLLSALGISTGSDGPTEEGLWRIDQAALAAVPDDASVHETNTAALRALFAAGRALGEQKQAARVAQLEAELDAAHRLARGELEAAGSWRRRATEAERERDGLRDSTKDAWSKVFDANTERNAFEDQARELRSELAATNANYAALHELHELTCKQSDAFAAEAAATKEKLAKAERERDRMKEERDQERSRGNDHLEAFSRKDAILRARLLDLQRANEELERARPVVEAAQRIADGTCIPREHSCHRPDVLALIAEVDALASAGTDADRTEAPKCSRCGSPGGSLDSNEPALCMSCWTKEPPPPEAGESGPVCTCMFTATSLDGTPPPPCPGCQARFAEASKPEPQMPDSVRAVIASRFRAGESVALLVDDYGRPVEQIEAAIRSEMPSKPEPQAGGSGKVEL